MKPKYKVQPCNHLDLNGTEFEGRNRYVVVGLLDGFKDYVIISSEHQSFKDAHELAKSLLCEDDRTGEELKPLEYHRPPTKGEIKFGEGAAHYKDFSPEQYMRIDGEIKSRLKCPIDGLIYTR